MSGLFIYLFIHSKLKKPLLMAQVYKSFWRSRAQIYTVSGITFWLESLYSRSHRPLQHKELNKQSKYVMLQRACTSADKGTAYDRELW